MNLRRALGAALLVLTGLVALAVPADAHSELVSSTPAEGAQLATAPTEIKLTFDEDVQLPPDPVKIEGRDGAAWQVGTATASGPVVTVPVTPAGPAQAYTLSYKVVAKDGDNVTGTLHFTLTAPVTTSAAAPASTSAQPPATSTVVPLGEARPGYPGWVWILLGVVLVLAALVVVLRLTRRRR